MKAEKMKAKIQTKLWYKFNKTFRRKNESLKKFGYILNIKVFHFKFPQTMIKNLKNF